jgi:UDPglucose--hexose-1-phosphate uridylyltransferase
MARYVPDIKTQRWVIISPGRIARPKSALSAGASLPIGEGLPAGRKECPFCPGNEHLTPPELYRIGSGDANTPGWSVRVVPNKFPITDLHEVIIHSPDDSKDIPDLPLEHVVKILSVYRDRYRAHDSDGQVLIFCNHGLAAGASLTHPHSQLVVIPKQINLDALSREPVANVVHENKYFVTYCPDFSQWPFEVWIAPKLESGKFGEIVDSEISDLAQILQTALIRIRQTQIGNNLHSVHDPDAFVYNYYIYHGANWYLRITPRFVHRAGFELGTGLSVNIADPTQAAQLLREVELK